MSAMFSPRFPSSSFSLDDVMSNDPTSWLCLATRYRLLFFFFVFFSLPGTPSGLWMSEMVLHSESTSQAANLALNTRCSKSSCHRFSPFPLIEMKIERSDTNRSSRPDQKLSPCSSDTASTKASTLANPNAFLPFVGTSSSHDSIMMGVTFSTPSSRPRVNGNGRGVVKIWDR